MSIGLALFVAICQTQHYRTGNEVWGRVTRFWGRFILISMAIGVLTGAEAGRPEAVRLMPALHVTTAPFGSA